MNIVGIAAYRTQSRLPEGTRLGPVTIAVTDADEALKVWRDMVGLTLIARDGDRLELGAGGETLIVLAADAKRPVEKGATGLYHVAIHLPTRRALAVALARLAAARFPNSPTDHLYTETTYLWDGDGNGIELTFETPWRGNLAEDGEDLHFVTNDGRRHSGRERLDVESLFSELEEGADLAEPMPSGTRVGHVHVHVNDLDEGMRFYADALGFGRQLMSRSFGMGDVTHDYVPHIIAFNIWQGADARRPSPDAAGLRHFELRLPSQEALAELRGRLEAAGHTVAREGGALTVADPSGNRLRLVEAG